ncbi:MAG: glycoside hydrolase family 92 protein, partial [Pyrinomonadaceae bacterium]|nr:glycoside hydrolase family 92 protein [Pyrinomonadaceae bacterium]
MNIKNLISRLIFVFLLVVTAYWLPLTAYSQTDYTKYLDPFIGTGGHGHTFPGATVPFGFVQLSPDTRVDNWDGSGGYHYSDDIIYGFSHTHLSGTGIPDYADILFAPYTANDTFFFDPKPEDTKNGYSSKFSHKNEKAAVGYYSVLLEDENILAEMTATKRVGLHRYTFPEKTFEAYINLDLDWRDEVLDSELRFVSDRRIEGFRRSKSWAKDQIVYFVAEFSKPFSVKAKFMREDKIYSRKLLRGKDIKTVFQFAVEKNEQILLKVAISPVSVEGARKNLGAELDHWDFEKVRSDANKAWNKELSKIEVSGGSDAQLTNFYTGLYHTMIAPNIYQDVDGKYLGMDKKIHSIGVSSPRVSKGLTVVDKALSSSSEDVEALPDGRATDTNYTVFSLWDTFRATHPLYTIIDEKRTVDFINTFIRQYEQGGKLPVWELAANETDTMIGYHAVSVIADAMAKGIKGFNYEKAFKAAKHSAELDIEGLEFYRRRGYISMEDEQESVSRTLEYAYNDYCVAVMAKILLERAIKKHDPNDRKSFMIRHPKNPKTAKSDAVPVYHKYRWDYEKHLKRSQFYKNLFDKQTKFMRPKQNGNWISPFAPNDVTFHFTEGNSWQYSFFVPHDVSGLMSLHGGKKSFAEKLDALFTADPKLVGRDQPDITGLIGQYAHGNEPSHHIAYLYNYADQPWKTQSYVRKIMDEFYKPAPDGLIGNEDCGQMSAWYVLSAMGFYQVNPSVPVYAIGSPIFREAKINLENGKKFLIRTKDVSEGRTHDSRQVAGNRAQYVKSVKLNGRPHRKSFFTHRDIQNGGVLEFEMTDKPVKNWFTESPVSKVEIDFPPVPTIEGKRVFREQTDVVISTPEEDVEIFYTTDGTVPGPDSDVYKGSFKVDKTTVVKAIAGKFGGETSLVAESKLNKLPNDWDVQLFSKYNRQYTGGGPKG